MKRMRQVATRSDRGNGSKSSDPTVQRTHGDCGWPSHREVGGDGSAPRWQAGTLVMRRFDPVGFAIYFADRAIALRPCIEEVRDLSGRIDQAYVRLRSEIVDV